LAVDGSFPGLSVTDVLLSVDGSGIISHVFIL
jgi:hypothetical protein